MYANFSNCCGLSQYMQWSRNKSRIPSKFVHMAPIKASQTNGDYWIKIQYSTQHSITFIVDVCNTIHCITNISILVFDVPHNIFLGGVWYTMHKLSKLGIWCSTQHIFNVGICFTIHKPLKFGIWYSTQHAFIVSAILYSVHRPSKCGIWCSTQHIFNVIGWYTIQILSNIGIWCSTQHTLMLVYTMPYNQLTNIGVWRFTFNVGVFELQNDLSMLVFD